jgi:hypothetical protein
MGPESNEDTADGSQLFGKPASDYGECYRGHLLEQYKLYVESAFQVTQWRTSTNSFLLAANTLLVTLYGYLLSRPDHHCCLAVPVAGQIVCVAWWFLIQSHKRLNSAKFKVIHELESCLPVRLFTHEWYVLVNEEKYRHVTWAESWIPGAFGLLYAIQLVVGICPVLTGAWTCLHRCICS